jgi:large subunit ribosomal protein L4
LPKKVKKAALASALSLRAQEKKLVIVDKLSFEAPKSKRIASVLKALGFTSALVVDAKGNVNLTKSIRNLASHACLPPEGLNVYDILNHGGLIIAKDAIKAVEARVIGAEAEAAS